MSKKEFVARVKETVRQVGYKYASVTRSGRGRPSPPRPFIGKPILIRPSGGAQPSLHHPLQGVSNPFDDRHSDRGSTFMTGSPSTSTAEHSIPRRRADFAPPRAIAQVHFEDGKLVRLNSNMSLKSERHGRASRTTSLRSGRSTRTASPLSHEYYPHGPPSPDETTAQARPRLVPFTSSTRVPVPRSSSLVLPSGEAESGGASNLAKSRVASQRARIYKEPNGDDDPFADSSVRRSTEPDCNGGSNARPEFTAAAGRHSICHSNRREIPHPNSDTGDDTVAAGSAGIWIGTPFVPAVRCEWSERAGRVYGDGVVERFGGVELGIYVDKECVARVAIEVIPRR
ncbi:hypothetical protein NMY22_g16361 [Coprinellus aureogranulatus]|nr:hypothetical protein NMY22_g16361 [Coprinellus aureogranulatus]